MPSLPACPPSRNAGRPYRVLITNTLNEAIYAVGIIRQRHRYQRRTAIAYARRISDHVPFPPVSIKQINMKRG